MNRSAARHTYISTRVSFTCAFRTGSAPMVGAGVTPMPLDTGIKGHSAMGTAMMI
jgi:hypothetical protein